MNEYRELKARYRAEFSCRADMKTYMEISENLDRELKQAIAADSKGDGFILDMFIDELENHDYSSTGEATEAVMACGLTWEQIINSKPLLTGLKKAMKEATAGL